MRYLPTDYQEFIHKSRYARWNEEHSRREIWPETVTRYFDFFVSYIKDVCKISIDDKEIQRCYNEVLTLGVMPSMRCLMTAGKALASDHIAGYNCAFIPIDNAHSFDETLFILMNGTGVGFSVERQFVSQLPVVPEKLECSDTAIIVRDSKRGWAEAVREFIAMLYSGRIPKVDISRLRPAGARLKIMGGRSSGPRPLLELFDFLIKIFQGAIGRKLTSLECHDIVCKVGDCVVVGGVRRSALLSLSNLSDQRMRDAKSGQWWELHPERALSNNSVAYTEKPDVGQFLAEWLALYMSKSGERGIFNRNAAVKQAIKSGRRKGYLDDTLKENIEFGCNPCFEIILRPNQFCNLSEVVAKSTDSFNDLARKVEIATIFGTWQSLLTKFRYIRRDWQRNCDEERLLGVSITGLMDCPLLNSISTNCIDIFEELKRVAVKTNKEWADMLNINQSTAVTCIKPSGTVSQLTCSSSGLHARHSPFYIRRVRQDLKDPLTKFLIDQGFPHELDVMKSNDMMVFSFPMRTPANAICRDDLTAIQQLTYWKFVQDHWCEHKPSVTITVNEHEWPSVGAWVWENFDDMSGVSFLPHSNHIYRQPPFEAVDESSLAELESKMPSLVDWKKFDEYEIEDTTTSTKELACTSGICEL